MPQRHLPGVVDARPQLNGESWRQLDALQRQISRGRHQRDQEANHSYKDFRSAHAHPFVTRASTRQ